MNDSNGTGWISLHRKIENNALWKNDEVACRKYAWIDLILMANHKDNEILVKNQLVTVKRGQRLTTERHLSERWNWSRQKTRDFIKILEKMGMIHTSTNTRLGTTITIVNYDKYQGNQPTNNTTDNTSKKQLKNHGLYQNNNDITMTNNDLNKINKSNATKVAAIFDKDSQEYYLAEYLYKSILKNDPKFKKPNFNSWAADIDKIIRIDKRNFEEIRAVIEYATNNDFWKSNILSAKKLRLKFPTLYQQAKLNHQKSSQGKLEQKKSVIENFFKEGD